MSTSEKGSRTLKFIVAMAFIVLSAIILLSSVLAIVTQNIQARQYIHLIEVVEKTAEISAKAEAHLVESGYQILEFTLWKDEALIDSAHEAVLNTDEHMDELIVLRERAGDSEAAEVRRLKKSLASFEDLLENYHRQTVEAGLDQDSGLQGSFRAAAHALEGLFEALGRDDLTVKYLMLRRHEKDFMLRLDSKYITRADAVIEELVLDIGRLPIGQVRIDEADALLQTYQSDFSQLTALMLRNNEILVELDSISNAMYPELEKMSDDAAILVEETSAEILLLRFTLSIMNVVFVVTSIAVALFLGILVFRRISVPLKRILSVTDDMAKGRLDTRANLVRMDEMGQIGSNVDRAGDTIMELVKTIKVAVNEGTALSDRLGAMAEETAAAIVEVSANIESIDKRTDDMNETTQGADKEVSSIVGRLEDLANAAGEQASSVTQSTASIEEMVASIANVNEIADEKNKAADQLSQIAEESRDGVKQTGELVDEITQLTESTRDAISVINAVASRTNLLAMNAAIEAAHAGDAGRGFSVVADEIRKLAESTGQNAKNINESLGAMVSKIELVREASQSSITAMEKMSTDVKGFTRSFAEISSSMSEMSIGSKEVLNASESLALLTQNLNRSIEEMQGNSTSVARSMESVTNLAGQVSDGVGEIGRASGEINSAATSLSRDGEDNRSLMNRIRELAERFRVDDDEDSDTD